MTLFGWFCLLSEIQVWDRCSVMRVSESVRLVLSVIRDTGVGQMQCNESK